MYRGRFEEFYRMKEANRPRGVRCMYEWQVLIQREMERGALR